jgi:hypothetical protein
MFHIEVEDLNRTGFCKHGNELSDSIKDRKFLDQLKDYYLLKKDLTLCILLVSMNLSFSEKINKVWFEIHVKLGLYWTDMNQADTQTEVFPLVSCV